MWLPDNVKSTPSGFYRWARNDRWTLCLKVTPGDSLSDARETAGSILSDLVFDSLLFWQWLQCTKCWIGKRITAEGHHLPTAGERKASEELPRWNMRGWIRKHSQKANLYLTYKHQKLYLDYCVLGMNEETEL